MPRWLPDKESDGDGGVPAGVVATVTFLGSVVVLGVVRVAVTDLAVVVVVVIGEVVVAKVVVGVLVVVW